MNEANFFHSWAFAFIIGCFIGGLIGFFTACILAASSKGSREDKAIYEATKREEARRGGPEIKIATQGKPEDA